MTQVTLSRIAAVLAALAFAALPARAQLFRAYLSLEGSDANSCTLAQPCRLLPAALAAVADGGEVWMLDSANFNTNVVDVTKSVTILAVPGALGSLVAVSGPALSIATPGVRVSLRNLNILPIVGSGGVGVDITNGTALTVEGCNFSGAPNNPSLYARAAAQVTVVDSVFRDGYWGILAQDGATVRVHGSRFVNNNTAIHVMGTGLTTTTVTVTRSVASNGITGFMAFNETAGSTTRLFVDDSVVESQEQAILGYAVAAATTEVSVSRTHVMRSVMAIRAEGTGTRLVAAGNTVTNNGTGLSQVAPAVFESNGANTVRGNGANSSGTITNVGTL
jgi:hypothetical protein